MPTQPLPGKVRESLIKERKLRPGLALVRWQSLPIVSKVGETQNSRNCMWFGLTRAKDALAREETAGVGGAGL